MNKKNNIFFSCLIPAIFCIVGLCWISLPSFFEIWKLQANDQIIRLAYHWQGKGAISPYIIHVCLDDQTIAEHKQDWDGHSSLFSQTIDILSEAGVESILMDIMFLSQPDSDSQHKIQENSARAGNVFFPLILSLADNLIPPTLKPLTLPKRSVWEPIIDDQELLPVGRLVLTNFEELDEVVAGHGHISSAPDRDGNYRRIPALIKTGSNWIPAIALMTVCHYLKVDPETIHIKPGSEILLPGAKLPEGQTKDIHIPIDKHGMIPINFSGPWNDALPHYSIGTLLELSKTENGLNTLVDELEGSIAVVSDISTGSRDFGPIPFSSYYPLSGLHANLLNSILEQKFIHVADIKWQVLLDLILILLLFIAAAYGGKRMFVVFSALILATMFVGVMFLYMRYRILIDPVRPSLSLTMSIPAVILWHFIQEQKNKQYIRARMSSYFAPSLMDKILKSPERLDAVEKKELTVLFSDIVGFTAWSSQTEATEIHQTLNEYFEEMAQIAFKHEGTIDKYIGDGLMVFFGDPVYNKDHSLLAVQAAIEMQQKTKELREKWEPEGRLPVHIRIGVNTGEVVVGNMGSSIRMDYTVIGSNVNLAQRLESNSSIDGILVTTRVRDLLKGRVATTSVGSINAKGFDEPVSVFSVDL